MANVINMKCTSQVVVSAPISVLCLEHNGFFVMNLLWR